MLCVMDIKSEYQQKTTLCVSDFSKLGALLHETHQAPSGTKVPKLDMYRFILSLSKIAHQMWRDHPFSHRNMTTEKTVGAGVGGDREVGVGGGVDKI